MATLTTPIQIYKKPLIRQMIISHERVLQLFPNLEELILIHGELHLSAYICTREGDDFLNDEGWSGSTACVYVYEGRFALYHAVKT